MVCPEEGVGLPEPATVPLAHRVLLRVELRLGLCEAHWELLGLAQAEGELVRLGDAVAVGHGVTEVEGLPEAQ